MGKKKVSRRPASTLASTAAAIKPGTQAATAAGTATATATALHLPEILERILSHLSPRALLTSAQRTSRAWHATIAGSPALQKRLFLLGDRDRPFARQRRNPLLLDAFGPLFFDIDDPATIRIRTPLWRPTSSSSSMTCFGPRDLVAAKLAIADMREGRRRHAAFVRSGASWRLMLVCQPPITRVRYLDRDERGGDGDGDDGSRSRDLRVEEGLRMGPLYDLVFGVLYGGDLGFGEGRGVWVGWKPTAAAVIGMQMGEMRRTPVTPWDWATARVRAVRRDGRWLGVDEELEYDYDEEVELIVRAVGKSRGRGGRYSRYNRYPGHMDDRADYLRTRSRTGSQWMFQCEDLDIADWKAVDEVLNSIFGGKAVISVTAR